MSASLYAAGAIRSELSRRGLRLQKRFGQNFLTSEALAARIADAAAQSAPPDAVCLEIGAGIGALTTQLAARFSDVCAIEIDRGIFPWLCENMAGKPQVRLVCEDALKSDFAALLAPYGTRPVCVCANLPYAVTGPMLVKLAAYKPAFCYLTLMLQKEAAARVCAAVNDADYGSLSAYLSYYGAAKRLFDVKEQNFFPRPAVTSTVLSLVPHTSPPVSPRNEELFFAVLRAAFSARRKTMLNCLAGAFSLPKEALLPLFAAAGVDANRRGETLSLQELCALSDALCEKVRT